MHAIFMVGFREKASFVNPLLEVNFEKISFRHFVERAKQVRHKRWRKSPVGRRRIGWEDEELG